MNIHKDVLFCQAPADFPHLLKIYNNLINERVSHTIEIVCLNSKIYLDYFKYLKLPNVSINYLDTIPFKILDFRGMLQIREKSLKNLKRLGLLNSKNRIYFTSIHDDPSTSYYIYVLSKMGHDIFYINHYDNLQGITSISHKSLKIKVKEFLLKAYTSIPFQYYNMSSRWSVIRFPFEKYNIKEFKVFLDKSICEQYSYRLKLPSDQKAVLIFSQPNRDNSLINTPDYDQLHIDWILKLKRMGYKIYTKGHPRIGICLVLQNLVDGVIPQYIPSELLDFTAFEACYGFLTIALASSAKLGIPSYSFLPCVKHKNAEYIDALNFLKTSSDNKIIFIEDVIKN